ncbi:hypothetical protein [Paracoccus endophyticus]|uniref:hypothetical protein n=1 Tax=Paracoccus endophyticus TaxID=2233774 RepID=UPI000DD627F3|nr:hypothetical protein [Paracoccus endophyticus]
MKEDILEQIVAEYLSHRGYFVRHNVKFRPDPPFREAMDGNPIRVLKFETMLFGVQEKLTQTLASTDIGRMIQIVRAARIKFVPE